MSIRFFPILGACSWWCVDQLVLGLRLYCLSTHSLSIPSARAPIDACCALLPRVGSRYSSRSKAASSSLCSFLLRSWCAWEAACSSWACLLCSLFLCLALVPSLLLVRYFDSHLVVLAFRLLSLDRLVRLVRQSLGELWVCLLCWFLSNWFFASARCALFRSVVLVTPTHRGVSACCILGLALRSVAQPLVAKAQTGSLLAARRFASLRGAWRVMFAQVMLQSSLESTRWEKGVTVRGRVRNIHSLTSCELC
jgi:hypothetical protein